MTTFVRVADHYFNLDTMYEIAVFEPDRQAHRKRLEVQLCRGEIAGRSAYDEDAALLRAYLEGREVEAVQYAMQPGGYRVIHLLSVAEPEVGGESEFVEGLAREEAEGVAS